MNKLVLDSDNKIENKSGNSSNSGKAIGYESKVMDGSSYDTKKNSGKILGTNTKIMNGSSKDTSSNSGTALGTSADINVPRDPNVKSNSGKVLGANANINTNKDPNVKSSSGKKLGMSADLRVNSDNIKSNSGKILGSNLGLIAENNDNAKSNSGTKLGTDADISVIKDPNVKSSSGTKLGSNLGLIAENNDNAKSNSGTTLGSNLGLIAENNDNAKSNSGKALGTDLGMPKIVLGPNEKQLSVFNNPPVDSNDGYKFNPNSGYDNKVSTNKILYANKIFDREDIQWYTRFNRLGCLDPYNAVTTTKEYLFFVKPDLHIFTPNTTKLNPELSDSPYFTELINRYPSIANQLQISARSAKSSGCYPFMNILSNSVKNTLDLPAITTTDIDTAATIYGTSIEYRGTGWSSDEKVDFSLEFEDTKYLELYQLFKAYEEYERLKKLGIVSPPNLNGNGAVNAYIRDKELHDQFGIYKFILDDDFSTIIYYAYITGVYFKNVPRDAFTDMREGGSLKYNIEFKGQFVDDMNPAILYDFNNLVTSYMTRGNQQIQVYNPKLYNSSDSEGNVSYFGGIDGRWAKNPYVVQVLQTNDNKSTWLSPKDMKWKYKLIWETDQTEGY